MIPLYKSNKHRCKACIDHRFYCKNIPAHNFNAFNFMHIHLHILSIYK